MPAVAQLEETIFTLIGFPRTSYCGTDKQKRTEMATKAVVAAVTALQQPIATQIYTTVMFALSTALLFADQNLLAPNVRTIHQTQC